MRCDMLRATNKNVKTFTTEPTEDTEKYPRFFSVPSVGSVVNAFSPLAEYP